MAAYLFALHALLSSVALSHVAANAAGPAAGDFATTICLNSSAPGSGHDEEGGGLPRQSPCSVCAATLTPVVLAAAILYLTPQPSAFEPAAPGQAAPTIARPISPRLSQGPPSVA